MERSFNMSNRYRYWTSRTAFCFERKFKCKDCSEFSYCNRQPSNNDLGLKSLKFAALRTFANIGLEGFNEAISRIGAQYERERDYKFMSEIPR